MQQLYYLLFEAAKYSYNNDEKDVFQMDKIYKIT